MNALIALGLFVAVASAAVLPELDGRITNGEFAKPGQFPYQAGLQIMSGEQSYWCGGSIISDRWILTAAHCVSAASSVTVLLGAFDIKNYYEKTQQSIRTTKKDIIVHEAYNPEPPTNDIALIKLPSPIKFNEYIQPAALPKIASTYSSYAGDLVVASGWGRYSDDSNSASRYLRYIDVPVMKQSTCKMAFAGLVTNNMICISTRGAKSTCNGDSGGPLVYQDGKTNYLIGITSFGVNLGCERGWPGVFTRVTSYLDWIEENTGVVNK